MSGAREQTTDEEMIKHLAAVFDTPQKRLGLMIKAYGKEAGTKAYLECERSDEVPS